MKTEPGRKEFQKSLFVDFIMALVFLALLTVALWIVWIYYFRGPIAIVTDRKSLQVEQEILAKARKDYSAHFHNMDSVVLAGIQTGSSCLVCHGDYPHWQDKKVRSLFNAHSWFIACEVCHLQFEDGEEIEYRWFDNDSGLKLTKLAGENSQYGAYIAPVVNGFLATKRLSALKNEDSIKAYLLAEDQFNDAQKKTALDAIHKALTKKPVHCDQCHKENGVLNFVELLYSPHVALYLESIDMGALTEIYQEFYFPDLLNQ